MTKEVVVATQAFLLEVQNFTCEVEEIVEVVGQEARMDQEEVSHPSLLSQIQNQAKPASSFRIITNLLSKTQDLSTSTK